MDHFVPLHAVEGDEALAAVVADVRSLLHVHPLPGGEGALYCIVLDH